MSRVSRDDPVARLHQLTEQTLEHIDAALSERQTLTARFLEEIEKEITEAKRMLDSLGQPWQHGEQSLPYEQFRHAVDRAITARTKDRRAEFLRDWSDRLRLIERRMELLRERATLSDNPR